MTKDGFTLIELLIVIALIAILAAVAGIAGRNWMEKTKIEEEIQRMHADLTNARFRAMARSRMHFLELLPPSTYRIWEDTEPGPDGDGVLQAVDPPTIPGAAVGGDTLLLRQMTRHDLQLPLPAIPEFDDRGIITNLGTIRIQNDFGAAMDCIVLTDTRIRLGRWTGANCQAL